MFRKHLYYIGDIVSMMHMVDALTFLCDYYFLYVYYFIYIGVTLTYKPFF